jgi:hypothetical protein
VGVVLTREQVTLVTTDPFGFESGPTGVDIEGASLLIRGGRVITAPGSRQPWGFGNPATREG